jgi:hypothetical protein
MRNTFLKYRSKPLMGLFDPKRRLLFFWNNEAGLHTIQQRIAIVLNIFSPISNAFMSE